MLASGDHTPSRASRTQAGSRRESSDIKHIYSRRVPGSLHRSMSSSPWETGRGNHTLQFWLQAGSRCSVLQCLRFKVELTRHKFRRVSHCNLSTLIQSSSLDKSIDLIPYSLVVVLLVNLVERYQLLGAVDHALDIDVAFREERSEAL